MPKVIITLVAAAIVVLLDIAGVLQGSVGGSFAVLLLLLVAALLAGMYDAWSMKRDVVGWIVSIVIAVIGILVGAAVGGAVLESTVTLTGLQGRPGPVFLALMTIISLMGSWILLWVSNHFRTGA